MELFKKPPKKKRAKKKKPRKYRIYGNKYASRHIDRSKIIEAIFDFNSRDQSYIANNKELLKEHKTFIRKSAYALNCQLSKLVVPEGLSKGLFPKKFDFFDKYYPCIYARWEQLVRATLDNSYYLYKFFGAKGIYISKDFLDSKKFCIWCLENKLTSKPGMYDAYLQRKDKKRMYSPSNCFVITEKEVHSCKSLKSVLSSLFLLKKYEEYHDPTVSYMTMYTRYYAYDMSIEDAVSTKYDTRNRGTTMETVGFVPRLFYLSIATEKDVPFSTYMSRVHYSYLNGGFTIRPYDLLKEDYSVDEEAAKQGKVSYKRQWLRNKKEREEQSSSPKAEQLILSSNLPNLTSLINSVYSNNPSVNVYDNKPIGD